MTGATSGIGWSVAQAFAEMGANIAIWYHTSTKGPEQAALIEKKYSVKCEFALVSQMLVMNVKEPRS